MLLISLNSLSQLVTGSGSGGALSNCTLSERSYIAMEEVALCYLVILKHHLELLWAYHHLTTVRPVFLLNHPQLHHHFGSYHQLPALATYNYMQVM